MLVTKNKFWTHLVNSAMTTAWYTKYLNSCYRSCREISFQYTYSWLTGNNIKSAQEWYCRQIFSEWCYVSSNHHSITLVHSMWMFYTKEHSGFLSKRDLHFEIQYKIFLHLHINIRFQDVLLVHIHDDDHILFWSWTNTLGQFWTKSITSVHTCWSLIMYKCYCASFWHFEHVFGNLSDM